MKFENFSFNKPCPECRGKKVEKKAEPFKLLGTSLEFILYWNFAPKKRLTIPMAIPWRRNEISHGTDCQLFIDASLRACLLHKPEIFQNVSNELRNLQLEHLNRGATRKPAKKKPGKKKPRKVSAGKTPWERIHGLIPCVGPFCLRFLTRIFSVICFEVVHSVANLTFG